MSQALNILQGGKAVDDRGFVSFVNEFNFDDVKRFYQVVNHNNAFIRAWHGHISEAKYVYVPSGAAIVGAVKMSDEYLLKINNGERVTDFSTMKAERFIISSANPCVLYIPPGYFNGFMNLKENTVIQFFSNKTLEESLLDDIRLSYDTWNIWDIENR